MDNPNTLGKMDMEAPAQSPSFQNGYNMMVIKNAVHNTGEPQKARHPP